MLWALNLRLNGHFGFRDTALVSRLRGGWAGCVFGRDARPERSLRNATPSPLGGICTDGTAWPPSTVGFDGDCRKPGNLGNLDHPTALPVLACQITSLA